MELISCEERLPEDFTKVLVLTDSNEYSIGHYDSLPKLWHIADLKLTGDVGDLCKIIYWAPLPTLPKKKRWMPKYGETYWFINAVADLGTWHYDDSAELYRKRFGVYKTKEEAHAMLDKIKAFVTEEIGEP